jgi:hypothetical protein
MPPQVSVPASKWQGRVMAGKRAQPLRAGEVVLREGELVEVVGYKTRVVDETISDRLERDTPLRATLRGGKELPLLISPSEN